MPQKKHDCSRGIDCMIYRFVSVKIKKKHATKIISHEKKEMIPLRNEENKL